jgi:hypothetical protein
VDRTNASMPERQARLDPFGKDPDA